MISAEKQEDEEDSLIANTDENFNNKIKEDKKPSIMFYLSQRTIFINLALMTIIWAIVGFNYYLIGATIKNLPGNFENNTLAMFSSDILVSLFCGYLVRTGCRAKILFMAYMLFAGIASL